MFRCAVCGNVYEKAWSDEEAMKESRELWGEIPEEEREVVCDDCFHNRSAKDVREMGNEYKGQFNVTNLTKSRKPCAKCGHNRWKTKEKGKKWECRKCGNIRNKSISAVNFNLH